MAPRTFSTCARQRLYTFAPRLATPFTDSRRRRFLTDMIPGLVIANHVHLSKVAPDAGHGSEDVHAAEKRLSRHLGSEHWHMSPLADRLLRDFAAWVNDDTLIVADLTDLAKYYARKMEGLGRIHDGSDPDKRLTPGYVLFEAYVRVRRWQLFPLRIEPLKTYAGAPTSENAEILDHVRAIHRATGGKGTWIRDRRFDRRNLFQALVADGVAFVARLVGDRHVRPDDGHPRAVTTLAEQRKLQRWPRPWPRRGYTACRAVHLPEVSSEEFLLVVHWRWPHSERPLPWLVSPWTWRRGRTGRWFVKAYRRRWGVADGRRGIQQPFALESFLVRSWRSIRRLLWLVGWALGWLNLWGEERFKRLREALMRHRWRLPKGVTYLFDWIAQMLHQLLHPRPKILLAPG
jgi:hypothetical protein